MGVGGRVNGSGREDEWEWEGGSVGVGVGVGGRMSGRGREGEWEWELW